MRSVLVITMLFAFGCAELRYPTRTEMVEAPPTLPVAPPPASAQAARTGRSWAGFVVGGAILSAIGVAFIVGGAVGLQRQQSADAVADAQCNAMNGWFCGTFDGLDGLPYDALIGTGAATLAGALALFIVGGSRYERSDAR